MTRTLVLCILFISLCGIFCDSQKRTLDLPLLTEYSLQNLEAISTIIPSHVDSKIPHELVSWSCRAFGVHSPSRAICKKFFQSFAMHLLADVTQLKEKEQSERCAAYSNTITPSFVHIPGGISSTTPLRNDGGNRTKILNRVARKALLEKMQDMWSELLEEQQMRTVSEDLTMQIAQLRAKHAQQDYCEWCKQFVGELEVYVKSHADEIEHLLINACSKAPNRTIEQVCVSVVILYGPQLLEYILAQRPPEIVCKPFCDQPTLGFSTR